MLFRNTLCIASMTAFAGLIGCGESDVTIEPAIDWFVVWNDEFDGEAGELPDVTRWAYDVGTGENGWGNAQLEFNTNRPENVSLDGEGSLAITALREDFSGSAYTSARIKTEGLFAQQYGRFEARIRLPTGQGMWPAFWMLGENLEEVGWPEAGEIDVMEFRGQDRGTIHGSLHGPGHSAGGAITRRYRAPDDGVFDEEFHVFAVEWDPSRISWWVDDTVYQVVTATEVQGRGDWVYDHPFHILLNLAVGGTFVGSPDNTTVFPQTMLVDYVRVFSRRPPQ